MRQFANPKFLFNILKSYMTDIDRLWKIDEKKLRKYQNKAIRNMIKYAYTVPLYHDKYKKAGIHPDDIKGIEDLLKLPFITKDDLRNNYPNRIIPRDFNKKNGFVISTSGSTGKPVFIYIDRFSAIRSLLIFARELKAYGGNWRKSKVALIIDLEPGSAEKAFFSESVTPFLKRFISIDNIKYIHLGDNPQKIIKELDDFNPEYLGSDPNMLRQLAHLKNERYGENVKPKYLFSSGSMLDDYTKNYVEKAFNAKVFDIYGTTEAGPLAFKCPNGNYHIHSDFVYFEFLDDKNQPVDFGEPGHIVITKLYGKGTPIIRYTGIDDIAIPIKENDCCKVTCQMIKKIEGRASELIYLPDGKTLSPLSVTGIPAKVMEKFDCHKIKQFQIIQHSLNDIEILIVLDKKQKQVEVTDEEILNELHKKFSEKIGNNVKIKITQTNEIQEDGKANQVKVIVTKIKK